MYHYQSFSTSVRYQYLSVMSSSTFLLCLNLKEKIANLYIVNQDGGLFWILSDSNVSLEEQIWLTECIYLADYFKLRKKKKKQNEMSFLITW